MCVSVKQRERKKERKKEIIGGEKYAMERPSENRYHTVHGTRPSANEEYKSIMY